MPLLTEPYDRWFPHAERDGTYGYDLDALRAIAPVPAPEGFAGLWRAWHAEAMATPTHPSLRPVGRTGAHLVSEFEFATVDGLRLRGWIALPAAGAPRVGIVHGHGYGGRAAPDFERVPDDAAVVFPVARGLGALNAGVGAPAAKDEHVLHGLESVDAYVLGRCAVDLWSAGNALLEITGPLPLYYVGESFGGGLGALAVPWDDRFVGATLIVPSFGQYDLRLQLPCEGSGASMSRHLRSHPEAREVLRHFDASTAAGFLRVPVRVECARWDVVVPPPGQFAVANAVASAAERGDGAELELDVLAAGHAEYPGAGEARARAAAATRRHLARALEGARAPRA